MPGYKFPTRKERIQLLEELKKMEAENGAELTGNDIYQNYKKAFAEMDKEMEKLSGTGERTKDNPMGLAPELTKEAKEKLLGLMVKAGKAGEAFLAMMQQEKKSLVHGIPGVVNKLQGIMSKDFDAISEYDPETKLTLPEIQEKARTRTIDLRGETLTKLGNMQSSRIPMTVRGSRGEKRKGVFTKANYNTVKSDFNKMLEEAAEKSSPEGKKEVKKILSSYKAFLINNNITKRNNEPITDKASDDYLIGHLRKYLYNHYRGDMSSAALEEFLEEKLELDVKKISKATMKKLTDGMNKLSENVGAEISNWNLELKEGDRVDHRNSCMSAVAGLLGASKLVARSDSMNYIDDNGNVVEGTFMDFGKGLDLDEHPELFKHVGDKPFKKMNQLLKQIADLQVIDFLCLNVDRHPGNLMYQVDKEGNVIGLQGIDNDSSFGTRDIKPDDILKLRVVSKSMADKLNTLTPEMLKFSLRGRGLTEDELNKSAERLTQIKEYIEAKMIKVVDDKSFNKINLADLKPPKNARNVFASVSKFISDGVKEARMSGLGFTPLEEEIDPKLKAISATERKGTVGGVEDTLRRLVVYDIKNKEGLVTKARGMSEKFRDLLGAVEQAKAFHTKLSKSEEYDKKAMLTEMDARPVLKASSTNFQSIMEKADAYLEYKMKEKGVKSLDELRGKNKYEQKHIDYAKKMLKFVEEYNSHLDGPKNDRERQETMANYEKRNIDMKKQAAEQIKKMGR
ncbi:MAG: hypothetical protein J5517_04820 [Eubacterium sp.]|nr:hypothetical protein [Eubacterium sp.]